MRGKDAVLRAMLAEVVAEKDYLAGEEIRTIYFGGGTPSLLDTTDLQQLLATVHKHHRVAADAEVTLEANPDDVSLEKTQAWRGLGINRLSIGVQSFFEEELRWMNRAHNARQANACIENSYAAGINNLSIDLIYGSPLLSDDMWERNVQTAVGYGIKHLSCYALTVEEKTPLHKHIRLHQSSDVDNDQQARQFLLLMEWLRTAGYEHYEVSNFAKPGFRSRHNAAYWKGVPYLGIGPSAHSYNGGERRWNVANNAVYVKSLEAGNPSRETERLTLTQQLNETVMIALRTREGLDLSAVKDKWGEAERRRLLNCLAEPVLTGWVCLSGNHACLTDEGFLRADGIAADLFV